MNDSGTMAGPYDVPDEAPDGTLLGRNAGPHDSSDAMPGRTTAGEEFSMGRVFASAALLMALAVPVAATAQTAPAPAAPTPAVPAEKAPAALDPIVAGLRPHRAVYELTLAGRSEKSEIGAVTGRLVYEFVGSTCDGFSTQFRLVTRLENTDGRSRVSDMRTSSFEDAAGTSFDFLTQNFVETTMTDESKGTAKRTEDGVASAVTRPVERKIELPTDINFPTRHMTKIIAAAVAGETLAQVKLYDGSEGGSRLYDTTAVIGKPLTGAEADSPEPVAERPELADIRRWPMTISYFDPEKRGRGEDTPEYQLSFLLYENGISRRLKLDYGDFALNGKLTDLKLIEMPACK